MSEGAELGGAIPGCSPHCPVPVLTQNVRQNDVVMKEVKESLKDLHTKSDEIIVAATNITFISKALDELKKEKSRAHENLFTRVGSLEKDHVGKADIADMVTKKDLKIASGVILLFIAILEYILRAH